MELLISAGLILAIVLLILIAFLPESLRYLVASHAPRERIAAILRRCRGSLIARWTALPVFSISTRARFRTPAKNTIMKPITALN